ncbi:peptidyl-tRNA hydrolase [Pseudonocardia dioxanivorans]|uniref:peptidyl-tRNA hydrolase n=1 Tax=Pseudonocardia dioxanivorans TaxID=240495 RepID=UPI000CD16179
MSASVLDAVVRRYVGAREIAPEADGVVRAMPVVLRIERELPGRTALLEAAARAALAVCVDPRAQPDGEWHDQVLTWVDGRIRKIARRARGAHWAAAQDLPGITVAVDGAEARALLPGPVDDVPKAVSRLQIGGTDLPVDEPGPPPAGAPVIWLNPTVAMTVGKAAAQVGHASMIDAAVRGLVDVPAYAVRVPGRDRWAALQGDVEAGAAVAVRDAGFTEVDPGTVTCVVTASG